MNITKAKLFKGADGGDWVVMTLDNGVGVCLSIDGETPEKKMYEQWLKQGNTPEPADE